MNGINRLKPHRVTISSPLRIDLGMGGISDLPIYAKKNPGRTLSLCASLNSTNPLSCTAEITNDNFIMLESEGRGPSKKIDSWDNLVKFSPQTSLIQASLLNLLGNHQKRNDFTKSIKSRFGGGLKIKISSNAPKGLGSSSILTAITLQALLRLLGKRIDWHEIVDRTVMIERIIGIGGGWEDALPAFFGGIVIANSNPSDSSILSGEKLNMKRKVMDELQQRLILFNSGIEGRSDFVLEQAIERYKSEKTGILDSCKSLFRTIDDVKRSLENGNITKLGSLLSYQWELWKKITGGACTSEQIDKIIEGAERYTDGVKLAGAGSGGAILFLSKVGKRQDLIDYLSNLNGSILNWSPDYNGYQIREWHSPTRVVDFIRKSLPNDLQTRVNYSRHGKLVNVEITTMKDGTNNNNLIGPLNPTIFELLPDLTLATVATAASLGNYVGTADDYNLKSTKKLIDSIASSVFTEEVNNWSVRADVSTAEGKDEFGNMAPTVNVVSTGPNRPSELRIAVDVVDGTTLAATGEDGAYCISSLAEGLRALPDLQAYAILAPKSIQDKLDLYTKPEKALEHNLKVTANALAKDMKDLVVVTHSDDTGFHHHELINQMKKMGIKVIIPSPVIVEPPYVVAACLGKKPKIDVMIGVFGLPEIVINTILCGALDREKGFVFRLASNSFLNNKEETTLDNAFKFTPKEKEEVLTRGLDIEKTYSFNDITSGRTCIFSGMAITDDPILGLKGVSNTKNTKVNGWIADPCGNLHKLTCTFARVNNIDYTARYPLELFDISLIAEMDSLVKPENLINKISILQKKIHHIVPDFYLQPTHELSDGSPGIHTTLFEFTVDYASTVSKADQEIAFQKAIEDIAFALEKSNKQFTIKIGKVILTSEGIQLDVSIGRELKKFLNLLAKKKSVEHFNKYSMPKRPHITLGRFINIPSKKAVKELDKILIDFNKQNKNSQFTIKKILLKKASTTPFQKCPDTTSIYIPTT